MAEPRLIFTGNVIVDLVLTVDDLPERGGDTIATSSSTTVGGGYNTMVAAARDGLPVVYAGRYGSGPFGARVAEALRAGGFDLASPGLDDVDSGYCVALVDSTTERTFVTTVGAEGRLQRADLDRVVVAPHDVVYVSGYSLAHPSNAAALVDWLPRLHPRTLVVTDPSPLVGEIPGGVLGPVLRRTSVLSLNRREARIATGLDEPAAAACALLGRLAPTAVVVLRDGADGCWVARADAEPHHVPGFRVDAVDSNGAGDAHGGVLSASLARGLDVERAALRANAAAALAVTRRGPATAPTTDAIDRLLAAGPVAP